MKTVLKQIGIVVGIIASFFFFLVGFILLTNKLFEIANDKWYFIPICMIAIGLGLFIGQIIPKFPTKDERLDNLENWIDHIRERWYERNGENL